MRQLVPDGFWLIATLVIAVLLVMVGFGGYIALRDRQQTSDCRLQVANRAAVRDLYTTLRDKPPFAFTMPGQYERWQDSLNDLLRKYPELVCTTGTVAEVPEPTD